MLWINTVDAISVSNFVIGLISRISMHKDKVLMLTSYKTQQELSRPSCPGAGWGCMVR